MGCQEKAFPLSKMNLAADLGLQSCIRTKSIGQIIPKWKYVVIMDHVWRKLNTAQTSHAKCQAQWWIADDSGFFIATGPLHLTVTELSINPYAYQSILESNQGIEVLQWTEMCTNFD